MHGSQCACLLWYGLVLSKHFHYGQAQLIGFWPPSSPCRHEAFWGHISKSCCEKTLTDPKNKYITINQKDYIFILNVPVAREFGLCCCIILPINCINSETRLHLVYYCQVWCVSLL